MMKKQSIVALALVLLIPVITMVGGTLSNLVNPEIAAGHPDYVRNYHLLNLLKMSIFFASLAAAAVLWLLSCVLVIRAKKRSRLWLLLAPLGPFGFAALAMLNDRAPGEVDAYTRFVRSMNAWVRAGYELCAFVLLWVLAYQAMLLNRELIVRYQAITGGMSRQQVIDIQNASGGMWAFSEGIEVMFLVVLFYLLRPILFCIAAGVLAKFGSARAQ